MESNKMLEIVITTWWNRSIVINWTLSVCCEHLYCCLFPNSPKENCIMLCTNDPFVFLDNGIRLSQSLKTSIKSQSQFEMKDIKLEILLLNLHPLLANICVSTVSKMIPLCFVFSVMLWLSSFQSDILICMFFYQTETGALQDILHLHDVLARVYLAKLCHSISRARVLDRKCTPRSLPFIIKVLEFDL